VIDVYISENCVKRCILDRTTFMMTGGFIDIRTKQLISFFFTFSVIYFIFWPFNICLFSRYAFNVLKVRRLFFFSLFGIFLTTTKKKTSTLPTSLTAQQLISIYYHIHPPTIATQPTHPHTSQLIHNGKQKIRQSYYHLFA
jgi:hypothetical protein